MALLYGRKIKVTVAGLEISEPRIALELDREIDDSQDKGRCDLYNLSIEHAARIHERGGPVRIEAGYPDTLAILFDGQAQRVTKERANLAHITRLHLGDMVRSARRLSGAFARSYAGAVPVRQIAADIVRDGLKLEHGPLDAIPEAATFPDFYWAGDPATAALDALLRRVGCTWFEADGIVRVNCPGHTQADAPRIMVTPQTGLIGTPIETDEGAECRVFLDARIVLGSVLDMRSDALAGAFKVVGTHTTADNWSGSFETRCDLRRLETETEDVT